ncbi:hypothetical protein BD413DRAFT_513918 [Trametes elegans]|nr:hypothetical protein BD413DRAFT_513918 [Trametes elegans]
MGRHQEPSTMPVLRLAFHSPVPYPSANHRSMPAHEQDALTLPYPNQTIHANNGKMQTFQLVITPAVKNSNLKGYLASYGLRKSGNRAVLLERLRAFSSSPAEWTNLFQPKHGRRRGDISSVKANKSHAAHRIQDLFGTNSEPTEYLPKKTGSETRVPLPINENILAANDAWAETVLKIHAPIYVPLVNDGTHACDQMNTEAIALPSSLTHDTHNQASQDAAVPETTNDLDTNSLRPAEPSAPGTSSDRGQITSIRRLERRVASVGDDITSQFGAMQKQITSMQLSLHAILQAQVCPPSPPVTSRTRAPDARIPLTSASNSSRFALPAWTSTLTQAAGSLTPMLVNTDILPSSLTATPTLGEQQDCPGQGRLSLGSQQQANSATVTLHDTSIPAENLLIFDIDGESLAFDKTKVPNPPPINFSDDIPRLFREWNHSTLLVVNGKGISVKHWGRFYKKRAHIKDHAWELLRVRWGTWKFLVEERERFPSEEAFWSEYSDEHGNHLSYQKIADALQRKRVQDDEHDSTAALQFFGGDLSQPAAHGYFSYKKSGKMHVCNKPAKVAERWRQLLQNHPEVAQEWEITRAQTACGPHSIPGSSRNTREVSNCNGGF